MIEGMYTLTADDLKACIRFEDTIALGNYDIDIHNPVGTGTSHYLFPDGHYYTVPYRCLVPLNTQNLLVTGRCISVTHEAQASIRIMPIVCCLGQAAGVAAAVAVKDKADVRQVNVPKVQALLKVPVQLPRTLRAAALLSNCKIPIMALPADQFFILIRKSQKVTTTFRESGELCDLFVI